MESIDQINRLIDPLGRRLTPKSDGHPTFTPHNRRSRTSSSPSTPRYRRRCSRRRRRQIPRAWPSTIGSAPCGQCGRAGPSGSPSSLPLVARSRLAVDCIYVGERVDILKKKQTTNVNAKRGLYFVFLLGSQNLEPRVCSYHSVRSPNGECKPYHGRSRRRGSPTACLCACMRQARGRHPHKAATLASNIIRATLYRPPQFNRSQVESLASACLPDRPRFNAPRAPQRVTQANKQASNIFEATERQWRAAAPTWTWRRRSSIARLQRLRTASSTWCVPIDRVRSPVAFVCCARMSVVHVCNVPLALASPKLSPSSHAST